MTTKASSSNLQTGHVIKAFFSLQVKVKFFSKRPLTWCCWTPPLF